MTNASILAAVIFAAACSSVAVAQEAEPEATPEAPEAPPSETNAAPDSADLEALNEAYKTFHSACENLTAEPPFNAPEGSDRSADMDAWKASIDSLVSSLKSANTDDDKLLKMIGAFEDEYGQYVSFVEKYSVINDDNVEEALNANTEGINKADAESLEDDKVISELLHDENQKDKDKMEYQIVDSLFGCLENLIVSTRAKLEDLSDIHIRKPEDS